MLWWYALIVTCLWCFSFVDQLVAYKENKGRFDKYLCIASIFMLSWGVLALFSDPCL